MPPSDYNKNVQQLNFLQKNVELGSIYYRLSADDVVKICIIHVNENGEQKRFVHATDISQVYYGSKNTRLVATLCSPYKYRMVILRDMYRINGRKCNVLTLEGVCKLLELPRMRGHPAFVKWANEVLIPHLTV